MELKVLQDEVASCRACGRLVEWRERVGVEKRRAYRDDEYWARPVPGFGDPAARLLILGLAPAAHGANRTGRMFTGDRSGDFLYAALHRAGFASQPTSVHRGDGLELRDAWVTAAVRCAPPDNKPLPPERDACAPFIRRELALLPGVRAILCLGGFAYEAAVRLIRDTGGTLPHPLPKFGHGVVVAVQGGPALVCSYHPSQQNTFTGRLTPAMLDDVLAIARGVIGG
ncbi:uracil-DNA glycosylase [Longimicrobium sp.]|uniref:uracil-DNA glycosylase n=1 Tax=Longimicrobium sp. TaxID=2029185 RepID=UPI002F93E4CB